MDWPPKAKTSTFVIGEKDACGEIMSRRPSLLRLRKETAANGRTAATEDEEKKGEREREKANTAQNSDRTVLTQI